MTPLKKLENMSRRDYARAKVCECKRDLDQAERLGAVDRGVYSWQDVFAGVTGVCIKNEDTIARLSDDSLDRIAASGIALDFFAARIYPMDRSRMIGVAEKLIAGYIEERVRLLAEGVFDEAFFAEYTWQTELYENTGVDVQGVSDLQNLSDDELHKIVTAYV